MLLQGNIYGVVGCWYLVVGIGFQPKLPTTYNQTPTTKHQQPIIIYFYLLIFYSSTIRPQVLSGRQYLAGVCSSHFYMFWYCLSDSSFLLVLNPETSSRIHESGCYMAGWHNVVINMVLLANYLKHMKK